MADLIKRAHNHVEALRWLAANARRIDTHRKATIQAAADHIGEMAGRIQELERELLAQGDAIARHETNRTYDIKRAERAEADAQRVRRTLSDLGLAVHNYQRAHDLHGDGSIDAGRAWDRMRRAREAAEAALACESGTDYTCAAPPEPPDDDCPAHGVRGDGAGTTRERNRSRPKV